MAVPDPTVFYKQVRGAIKPNLKPEPMSLFETGNAWGLKCVCVCGGVAKALFSKIFACVSPISIPYVLLLWLSQREAASQDGLAWGTCVRVYVCVFV